MKYNPFFPNPIEVLNETLFSENFHYLIFLGWTAIVIVGMFCFCIMQCISPKYKENKIVLRIELGISIIIKFLLLFQFFPLDFDSTFFYFFIFLLMFMFGFEYLKLLTNYRKFRSRILSITLIIFLIYAFYIVSIRNLYNSTYHPSCIYTEEDALKYIM